MDSRTVSGMVRVSVRTFGQAKTLGFFSNHIYVMMARRVRREDRSGGREEAGSSRKEIQWCWKLES
jgi:hypothetical protein